VRRTLYEPDHEIFRTSVRAFIEEEILPHYSRWEEAGAVDRALFEAAGERGLLGISVPEEFGGSGVQDFR